MTISKSQNGLLTIYGEEMENSSKEENPSNRLLNSGYFWRQAVAKLPFSMSHLIVAPNPLLTQGASPKGDLNLNDASGIFLSWKVTQLASYFEPLILAAVGVASKMLDHQQQMTVLDQTKTLAESALQMLYAAKEGGGNPKVWFWDPTSLLCYLLPRKIPPSWFSSLKGKEPNGFPNRYS